MLSKNCNIVLSFISILLLSSVSSLQVQKEIEGFQVTMGQTPGMDLFDIDIVSEDRQKNFYGVFDSETIKMITNEIFQTPRDLFVYINDYIHEQNILDLDKIMSEKKIRINIHQRLPNQVKITEAVFGLTPTQIKEYVQHKIERIQHLRNHEDGDSEKDLLVEQTLEEEEGTYEGQTLNGKKHGTGTFTYKANDKQMRTNFVGEWKYGQKQGKGVMSFKTKASYDGEWKNDQMDGEGVMLYCNGFRYEGNFKEGKRSGQGKVYSPCNTLRFQGQFQNDMPEGKGFSYCPTGQKSEASFTKGMAQGAGLITYPNGDRLECNFTNNRLDGLATKYFSNGNVQTLIYQQGLLNGESVLTQADGTVVKYQFIQNRLVSNNK